MHFSFAIVRWHKDCLRKVIREPGKSWIQEDQPLNSEVFVANLNGSHQRNLSTSPAYDGWPVWSPDSRWIAFSSNRDGVRGEGQVFEIHPDGTGLRQVTQPPRSHVQACYAPHGRALVVAAYSPASLAESAEVIRVILTRQ
jgi:Tol biopolymer transport system component